MVAGLEKPDGVQGMPGIGGLAVKESVRIPARGAVEFVDSDWCIRGVNPPMLISIRDGCDQGAISITENILP